MNKEKYTQQIVDNLFLLPQDKVVEVLDFVNFLVGQTRNKGVPLSMTGLTHEEARNLQIRLTTFEDDWNASGMDTYNDL